jgi:hypothetical protein
MRKDPALGHLHLDSKIGSLRRKTRQNCRCATSTGSTSPLEALYEGSGCTTPVTFTFTFDETQSLQLALQARQGRGKSGLPSLRWPFLMGVQLGMALGASALEAPVEVPRLEGGTDASREDQAERAVAGEVITRLPKRGPQPVQAR